MISSIVQFEQVTVAFENNVVLEDINFSIGENDFLGIIGPNGGGKTTLLKVMLGLISPVKGNVQVFGKNPAQVSPWIGYVPQHSLFDRDFPVTVIEVVLMGRVHRTRPGRYYARQDHTIAEDALKRVGMYEYRSRQIGTLSGGQQQRVFVARALTTQPKLLLLDEPTSSVDTCAETEIYELLKSLKSEMAIVLISHDIGVISTYVEKIACLNRKLFYHNTKEITKEDLAAVYHCPVELIAHGVPHRVMQEHQDHEKK